jgi:hypothetical protein
MKKTIYILMLGATVLSSACTKSDFEEAYPNPALLNEQTIPKHFSGIMYTNREYVVPAYWDYFVVLRTTLRRWTQANGWVTEPNQYVPGAASVGDRWGNFYAMLAQFKDFQTFYNSRPAEEQKDFRIFYLAAKVYVYDHTQKVIDLHGDIPWKNAGLLSTNSGDYTVSYASYDKASDLYTMMLDDLKSIADELSTITINSGVLGSFKTQDLVNRGDVMLWRKYTNSLRFRMLTRVSAASAFTARANSERGEILNNATKYPLINNNSENVQINVYDVNTAINANGFQTGLEDWNGNLAGKVMIDHMNTNTDPRIRALFEPGAMNGGVYKGLDPMASISVQEAEVRDQKIAFYNRSTLSRNRFHPGRLINAAEVSFLKAEYYLNSGNMSMAKSSYEMGIQQSMEMHFQVRSLSTDNTAGALAPLQASEVTAYLAKPAIAWDMATTNAARLSLIANQKWLHFSVVQMQESWAELRRLDLPALSFPADASNQQTQPPKRWLYPTSEVSFNTSNYEAVKGSDNLNTKIFWDIN